jgi:hypothetical protein
MVVKNPSDIEDGGIDNVIKGVVILNGQPIPFYEATSPTPNEFYIDRVTPNNNINSSVNRTINIPGPWPGFAWLYDMEYYIRWDAGAGNPGNFDFQFYGRTSYGSPLVTISPSVNTSQIVDKDPASHKPFGPGEPLNDYLENEPVRAGYFDLIGVILFNFTGTWDAVNRADLVFGFSSRVKTNLTAYI